MNYELVPNINNNIVAPLSLSSLPLKLICCFQSGFSYSIFWFKSMAISLQCFEKYLLSSKLTFD